jgi:hypothetical protein
MKSAILAGFANFILYLVLFVALFEACSSKNPVEPVQYQDCDKEIYNCRVGAPHLRWRWVEVYADTVVVNPGTVVIVDSLPVR